MAIFNENTGHVKDKTVLPRLGLGVILAAMKDSRSGRYLLSSNLGRVYRV